MQLLVFVGLLLVACTRADDFLEGKRRDLLQFCHPQRSTAIGNRAIGAFFTHPELGGMKVDYCLGLDYGCGKRAADKFCELKGMKFAESYIQWDRAGVACGGTRTIESMEICEGDCTGFRVISCAGSLMPNILDTILGSEDDSAPIESAPEEIPNLSQDEEHAIGEEASGSPSEGLDDAPPQRASEQIEDVDEEKVEESTKEEAKEGTKTNKVDLPEAPSGKTVSDPNASVDLKVEPTESTETPDGGPGSSREAGSKDEKPETNSKDGSSSESKDTDSQNGGDGAQAEDDEIEIDHPDLGEVILPGQDQPVRDDQAPPGGSEAEEKAPGSQESAESKDSIFCQERGSQSSIAAARNGCGSVLSVCASPAAIAESRDASRDSGSDSVSGATGRRLTQQVVNTEECKSLFASECQAAAFDNAHGLCSVLMGNGPNPGEEMAGCETAEQARNVFKKSVKEACDKFMAGAFP